MKSLIAVTFVVSAVLFSVRPTDAFTLSLHSSSLTTSFLSGDSRIRNKGRLPVLFSHDEESDREIDNTDDIVGSTSIQLDNIDASNKSPRKVENKECSEEASVQQPSFQDRLEALGIKPVSVSSLRRKAVAPPSLPKSQSPSLSNPSEHEEKEKISAMDMDMDPASSSASTNESEDDKDMHMLSSHYDPASEMEKLTPKPTPPTSTMPATVAPWPALPPTTLGR